VGAALQNLFLYMGVPDDKGEYPLARFDDQPELWVSEASLVHYVVHMAEEVVDCAFDFGPFLARAKKRNRKHRETFSKHSKVATILERT
jgi:hypothetical protein